MTDTHSISCFSETVGLSTLLKAEWPNYPVLYMSRRKLKEQTDLFLNNFPGKVLYAVKCNPDRQVVSFLNSLGVHGFDVASLPEIRLINDIAPGRECYFNHPIKSSEAIYIAYKEFGVRNFVVDSYPELEKILAALPCEDITIQLRLNVATGSQTYNFATKFGLSVDTALDLSNKLAHRCISWGITFHVGSQCESPKSYVEALEQCRQLISLSETKPDYINVGGGFPICPGMNNIPPIMDFLKAIGQTAKNLQLPPLICEPGRALVASAGKLVCRVVLRNGNRLYLNDGVYGAFGEINFAKMTLTGRAFNSSKEITGKLKEFHIFGPTCDSFDALDKPLLLPEDIKTNDWLVFDNMGAYSTSLANKFNGFSSESICMTE